MMRKLISLAAIAAAITVFAATGALAEGNLASRATRLDPLVLGADLSFSVKEFRLETGKYYRWRIESTGGEEFLVQSPGLFRNSWVNQIVINDIEVKPVGGGIYGIEFDDEGVADVWFVPIRPGEYEYYALGYQSRGMTGKLVVR